MKAHMTDIIEERLNALANQIAAEGMALRAADVRAGAVEIARQRHEIERLQAAVHEASRGGVETADLMQAEIARLRMALQEIATYPHSEYGGEIARRALEQKP